MSKEPKKNSPKLLLDEHIWAYLAKLLREQGFDVIHVYESGLDSKPDHEILRVAVENIVPLLHLTSSISFHLHLNILKMAKSIMASWFLMKFRRANYRSG